MVITICVFGSTPVAPFSGETAATEGGVTLIVTSRVFVSFAVVMTSILVPLSFL